MGFLHEQLDELELAIAEAELGELSKKLEDGDRGVGQPPLGPRPEPLPRFTSDAVRKLFRDVAKTVHPDLAHDDEARGRRHALMAEANRAYARVWKLKAMVDQAALQGKDVVREIVERLKRDIMVATNRLDAMRPPR